MKDFSEYLQAQQFSKSTLTGYLRYAKYFLTWLQNKNLEAETTTYSDLLSFIKNLQGEGKNKRYINQQLCVIRHYFDWLKRDKKITKNPATGLIVKGTSRRIPHDLLSNEQLEEIYNNYQSKGISGKRNKAMLGLLIYQCIKPEELAKLEPSHLRLREGKIYIPGTRRTNSRLLKLESHQIMGLQEYTTKTRELIFAVTEKESNKLFISIGDSHNLRNSLDKLMRSLRKKYDYFKNAEQIRQSVITHWIKLHDIRQVQYMSGHKYVSSTERYQADDLQDLQKELDKYHPLK